MLYYQNYGSSASSVTLDDVYNKIKTENSDTCSSIRSLEYNSEDYILQKQELPFVLFHSESVNIPFYSTKDSKRYLLPSMEEVDQWETHNIHEDVATMSNYLCFDIDGVTASNIKSDILLKNEYSMAFESGNGIKLIVKYDNTGVTIDNFVHVYSQACEYFSQLYNYKMDPIQGHLQRICFLWYDNDIIKKDDYIWIPDLEKIRLSRMVNYIPDER